jgi:hypothetical protein
MDIFPFFANAIAAGHKEFIGVWPGIQCII